MMIEPAHGMLRWRRTIAVVALLAGAACGAPGEQGTTLYQRLGAEDGVAAIAGDLVDSLSSDPATRRSFVGVDRARMKARVAIHLCQVADGPCRYDGGSMAKVHRDLDVTEAEFAQAVGKLQAILDRRASMADKNELLRRLALFKREIATGPRGDDWGALASPSARR